MNNLQNFIDSILNKCNDLLTVSPKQEALKSVMEDPTVNKSCILEFGVASGRTINLISNYTDNVVYGFDSFEGLPEDWNNRLPKGFFKCDMPKVNKNVVLIKGLFNDTLPFFKSRMLFNKPIDILHIDCDLYSSTKTIFNSLKDNIGKNTVIVFDELYDYEGFEDHEIKAFYEFVNEFKHEFEVIYVSPNRVGVKGHPMSVAVRIT